MLQNRDAEGRELGPGSRDKPNHTAQYTSKPGAHKERGSAEVEVPDLTIGGLGRSMSSAASGEQVPSVGERAGSGPPAWATGNALEPDRPRRAQALVPQ
ncbi:hypothetical protein ColTof4_12599 [Colletotrichum tofieldiae]|nr:hypothetical protein ColTof3_06447 [Colletotrichum tofieldiae]GKT80176.1 hypothetical protein ColTof4_12599 [Colletotrichum tofieldiae]